VKISRGYIEERLTVMPFGGYCWAWSVLLVTRSRLPVTPLEQHLALHLRTDQPIIWRDLPGVRTITARVIMDHRRAPPWSR